MKVQKFGITYDSETGEFTKDGKSVLLSYGDGYVYLSVKGKTFSGQRAAYLFMTDRLPSLHMDHINGDRKDNRWGNLREITQTQNNRLRPAYSATGFKGVYAKGARFTAKITVNKKKIYLGHFATKEDAARAYDAAALKYFGAMSRLNFAV